MTTVTAIVTFDDIDYTITAADLQLEDCEGSPMLSASVKVAWTDEDGIDCMGTYSYSQWVNDGEIARVDRYDGWHHEAGDVLPEYDEEDIEAEVERAIEASDFELSGLDPSVEEVIEALKERDEDLILCGRDPYHNHHWKIGRWLDEARRIHVTVAHESTLSGVIAWAREDAGPPFWALQAACPPIDNP